MHREKADPASGGHFGTPHPTLQKYECTYEDFQGLMASMAPDHNPLIKWKRSSQTLELPTSKDVTSWFRGDSHVAFYSPPGSGRNPITYEQLHQQVRSFVSYETSGNTNDAFVVALWLPPAYMTEMAIALVTLLAQHSNHGVCVAPIDPNMAPTKIEAALSQLQCTALVTTNDLFQGLSKDHRERLRDVRFVQAKDDGIEWTKIKTSPLEGAHFGLEDSHRPAMLLRTSGTTSTPKMVPITLKALLYNAAGLAASLRLDAETDVGCNAMPLFHIGGISCGLLAILVSGSSVVMMPGPFDSQAFLDAIVGPTDSGNFVQPTWYYGVPSMHKALLLTAEAHPSLVKKNRLRFIRSGAAHLSHGTALELARTFQTHVYPTYSMSECMPVCSSHDAPISVEPVHRHNESYREVHREGVPDDTVGVPIGCSLAILGEHGDVLSYGTIGQVGLKGPGVMQRYIGVPTTESHTANGWFLTGDMGQLDPNGRLVLSGRLKEMIKRGGDQVWPNEVDSVVESVEGVRVAVTFGVANELWGEEVQVAVVLDSDASTDKESLNEAIAKVCTENLGPASAPSLVHYISSTLDLPKGSTGKFLRTKMAEHLGARPVDTGALHALEAMAALSLPQDVQVSEAATSKATPSSALNGVRFLTACFVVQSHVGLMPNSAWLKIQSFSLNMMVFFSLGAFQLATSVKSQVKSNSAQFIGTKIGSMHALFVVTQLLALASYLVFQCGESGYAETFDDKSCTEDFPGLFITFVLNTLTGMLTLADPVNPPSWFQTAFYMFLMLFPVLDYRLRRRGKCQTNTIFWVNLFIGTVVMAGVFEAGLFVLNFTILSWLPLLVSAMIAGYWFSEHASTEEKEEDSTSSTGTGTGSESQKSLFQRPRLWGIIADTMSITMILCEVIVGWSGGCVPILLDNYKMARPGEALPEDTFEHDGQEYGTVCDLSYDEFVEYVHDEPDDDLNLGRWTTNFGGAVGFFRLGTPLVLLWVFALAYGRGVTAAAMKTKPMQVLAPLAYPLYLLHIPVARLYWVATRGHEAEFWWPDASAYPFPMKWYELFLIIGICLVLAIPLDRFVVQYLSQYTIGWGVGICKWLAARCCCCLRSSSDKDGEGQGIGPGQGEGSTLQQVERMVKGLTGNVDVNRGTKLGDLGLDSLGATALLGTLRSVVPAARHLTLSELSTCDTVGDLVDLLEGKVEVDVEVDVDVEDQKLSGGGAQEQHPPDMSV